MATAVIAPLIGVHQLDAASSAQTRLSTAQSELDALLRVQLDEQSSLRGYLSTHDPAFADDNPPNPAFDRMARDLEELLRSAGLSEAIATVNDMRVRHTTWEEQVALPLLRRPNSSDSYAQQQNGKFLTDLMSRDADAIRGVLNIARFNVEQGLRRSINATVAVSAGFVTLFAIIALWYAIGRATAIARLAEGQLLVDALQRTLRVGGQRLAATEIGTVGPERGWFLIADASGKGIEAARHAAFTQYAIRALAADSDDPADVVARFNRLFLDTFEDPSVFVVVFLGTFDARTQTMRYASAGHGTAYVRRGSIIGIDRDGEYATETVPLALGDMVLLATDGLSEARSEDGELLGEDRVAAILRDAPPDPQALCNLLVASADAYSGGVQDDLAILALRVVTENASATTAFRAIGGAVSS